MLSFPALNFSPLLIFLFLSSTFPALFLFFFCSKLLPFISIPFLLLFPVFSNLTFYSLPSLSFLLLFSFPFTTLPLLLSRFSPSISVCLYLLPSFSISFLSFYSFRSPLYFPSTSIPPFLFSYYFSSIPFFSLLNFRSFLPFYSFRHLLLLTFFPLLSFSSSVYLPSTLSVSYHSF